MPVAFIGTSHISSQSVARIKESFLALRPDIVAIELDHNRLQALLSNAKPSFSIRQVRTIGLAGYLFALIGAALQRRLGKLVGMEPGSDMKQAALLAKRNNVMVALIDQDIRVTLRRLSKELTRKERWRLVYDVLFGWADRRNRVRFDLRTVPEQELITVLLTQLQGRYPTFYKVLVEERNEYMAKRLATLSHQHPEKTIMVVVGAGHLEGLQKAFAQNITFLNNLAQKTGQHAS